MSLSSKQLEQEIAAMEGRLATVKVTVEIEKDAWKKVARKGKLGTKWKGAASTSSGKTGKSGAAPLAVHAATSRSEIENADGEIVIEPLQWDSLELAHYLQSKQLASYATVVVHEQITGKLLLDTAPGKLKVLFQELVAGKSDPNWKNFLRVCSEVHKLQKSIDSRVDSQADDMDMVSDREKRKARSPPKTQSSAPLFPAISPRIPAIQASALASKGPRHPPAPSLTQSLSVGGDDSTKRLKTSVPHAVLRKSMAGNNQPKATCWNCGALFPRAPAPPSTSTRAGTEGAGKQTQTAKLYCSHACRDLMESNDMSVSATISLGVRQPSSKDLKAKAPDSDQGPTPKPPPHATTQLAAVIKSPRHRGPGATQTANEGFDFLHVAHRGPPQPQQSDAEASRVLGGLSKQASNRMRIIASQGQGHYQLSQGTGSSGSLSHVASIMPVRCLPEDAIPPSLLRYAPQSHPQPRAPQQSLYKLDPEMFHATGIRWTMCFDASMPHSPTQRQGSTNHRAANLERVVEFLSFKAVYFLSLTCQKWFELIHVLPVSSERVWGALFRRTWQQTPEDDQCLRDLGYTNGKPKKPRRLVMKLTRQVQKIVHEDMKILVNPENWQLAPVCKQELDYIPISCVRFGRPPTSSSSPEPIDRGNDLYEVIIVILKPSGEIVAIQAQELIRPITEDGSTIEILQGLKSGALLGVQCRRLRLFSLSNRLPVSEWYLLPDVSVLLEFCEVSKDAPQPTIWQLKVLAKLQKSMEKRLLGKDSVQQIMRWTQERSMGQQAMDALEQFLVLHVPSLMSSTATASTKSSQRRPLV